MNDIKLNLEFVWGTQEELEKRSIRMVRVPVKILNRHLPDTNSRQVTVFRYAVLNRHLPDTTAGKSLCSGTLF